MYVQLVSNVVVENNRQEQWTEYIGKDIFSKLESESLEIGRLLNFMILKSNKSINKQ